MYSHLNNSIYYHLFDSVVNTYLITHSGLEPATSPQIGLVVHSNAHFFSAVSFPAVLDLCLCVTRLGTSSVRYEIAVFEQGREDVCVVGEFVHVFVSREKRRPEAGGMTVGLRDGLGAILRGRGKARL